MDAMSHLSDITQEEFEDRLSKAQRLLKDQNLDAFFLTECENINYMTGYIEALPWEGVKNRVWILIVSKEKAPVFIFPEINRQMAKSSTWFDDLRGYSGLSDADQLIRKTITDLGLTGGRIGAELGPFTRISMPASMLLNLVKTANAEFVDGSDAIWKMRMVKSKSEIDRMRVAAQATSRGLDRAFEEIKEGMTEREFCRIISLRIIEEGADSPQAVICQSGEKFRKRISGGFPSDLRIRKGSYVQVDLGAFYRHYTSDMNRVAFFGGQPSMKEMDDYALYAEANKRGTEALRPGVSCGDVHKAIHSVFEEAGIQGKRESVGHGIGLEVHEPPHITISDNTSLQAGMVLAIEPSHIPGVTNFNCEDDVAVTETGHERLSTMSRELRII